MDEVKSVPLKSITNQGVLTFLIVNISIVIKILKEQIDINY